MSSRLIIESGDISSSPVLGRKFRGKVAKEIYRCGKGMVFTGSVSKPIGFAVSTIPVELSKGIFHQTIIKIDLKIYKFNNSFLLINYKFQLQPDYTDPNKQFCRILTTNSVVLVVRMHHNWHGWLSAMAAATTSTAS